MKNAIAALIGVVGLAGAASAQNGHGYLFTVEYGGGGSSINPSFPSATVRVWADFGSDYAWATGNANIVAGESGWGAYGLKLGVEGVFGRTAGTLSGAAVNGMLTGQFNSAALGELAKTDKPILIWEGTWSTADFSARTVSLATTGTVNYRTYATNVSTSTSRLDLFKAGSGGIEVTPAPSALALLGLGGLAAARRRR